MALFAKHLHQIVDSRALGLRQRQLRGPQFLARVCRDLAIDGALATDLSHGCERALLWSAIEVKATSEGLRRRVQGIDKSQCEESEMRK